MTGQGPKTLTETLFSSQKPGKGPPGNHKAQEKYTRRKSKIKESANFVYDITQLQNKP